MEKAKKNFNIKKAIEDIIKKNEKLWKASRFVEKDKSIFAYGHSKKEALANLKQKYQDYINSKEKETSNEKLDVMAHKQDSSQITKKLYKHCIIESNEKELQDEELEIEE